jgi:hypothetical protein
MKQLKIPLLAILTVITLFSCQNDDLTTTTNEQNITDSNIDADGMIVLGEKLENPYSVKNMKIAYDSLKNSGTLKSALTDTF